MKLPTAERIPHSWSIDDWPPSVYPCRPTRARYMIRMHRQDLMNAGALTRIGRDLVILGAGYAAWLQRQSSKVGGFQIAPNRVRGAFSHAEATAPSEEK